MIRIAFMVDTISTPGAGTESQLLMLLEALARDRFEPTLVCLRDSDWLRRQSFPFNVHVLKLPSLLRPNFMRACRAFQELQHKNRFDLVQVFTIDSNYFGTVAARLSGIEDIVSCRRDMGYWQNSLSRTLLRLLRRYTPYYLANSKAAARACTANEGVAPERITVIHNGLDVAKYSTISEDTRHRQRELWGVRNEEVLIGAVANLRPVKNIEILIGAARELLREPRRLRFVVVGEGPSRLELQARIDRLGLTEHFLLPGRYEDVVSCLAAFDIGVLCSKSESMSNSLLEYMAAGVPIVASAVGAADEVIQHGKTGLLYDPLDPAGLVKTLELLLDDESLAVRMKGRAREEVGSRFNKEACVELHQAFYARIVKARRSG